MGFWAWKINEIIFSLAETTSLLLPFLWLVINNYHSRYYMQMLEEYYKCKRCHVKVHVLSLIFFPPKQVFFSLWFYNEELLQYERLHLHLSKILVRTYVIQLLGTYVTILYNWLILWQNVLYLYLGRFRMCLL